MRGILLWTARGLGLALVVASIIYLFFGTAVFSGGPDGRCMPDTACLTSTHWKQMGGFEQYMPDKNRIGCWGTALAQVAYYYRLQPHGRVAYRSSRGISVDEDLGSNVFDFSMLESNQAAMARYSYYAALVVRKDFGTGNNMDLLPSPREWERHYAVKVERYICWHGILPYTTARLAAIVCSELREKRPVFLHFANLRDMGHSVVVDGYCYREGRLFMHMNQGQGGPSDGWYEWPKGILRDDDWKLRVIYTVRPVN
jgi:hypothetical protein